MSKRHFCSRWIGSSVSDSSLDDGEDSDMFDSAWAVSCSMTAIPTMCSSSSRRMADTPDATRPVGRTSLRGILRALAADEMTRREEELEEERWTHRKASPSEASLMATIPLCLTARKALSCVFFNRPCMVSMTRQSCSSTGSDAESGIMAVISSPAGMPICTRGVPEDCLELSGIWKALTEYTIPRSLKNNTWSRDLQCTIFIIVSFSRSLPPLFPLVPLLCSVKVLGGILLM
mmetsp:Transcript_6561/g.8901  ORF Transcript_6561/g.8901 Transcript_6561/m.8901 type:complete len:233 (+) Transcript_6561:440-1138(+)